MIPIAQPLASANTVRRIQKIIKETRQTPKLHRGIKHCQKAVMRCSKGLLILCADITPMDLITHLPGICEEKNIPYIFVGSKQDLKIASPKSECVTCCFVEVESYSKGERVAKVVAKSCCNREDPSFFN
ncbi:UNVERIFIED_CONTAM: hypothetical protein PYX00_011337 [Menopon gallinae]|uniref:Ribosomal protein eL8/eL30/eS12/Gadd45 domain-containing protein n=1 Tax=Menopon gallinae TaxID=328185 RepID=A0AAW2H792_9NEOP